jgi:hypothetical protein
MPEKIMYDCDVCGAPFQFGPHVYAGKSIPLYEIMVCTSCYKGNWGGWQPRLEGRVLQKLGAAGRPEPARLPNGLLPRE